MIFAPKNLKALLLVGKIKERVQCEGSVFGHFFGVVFILLH